jgi:hypothetical protein
MRASSNPVLADRSVEGGGDRASLPATAPMRVRQLNGQTVERYFQFTK